MLSRAAWFHYPYTEAIKPPCSFSKPVWRARIASLGPSARRGARGIARVVRQDKDVLSDDRMPEARSTAGCRAIRAAFSFAHFFWPSKRNGPARGAETALSCSSSPKAIRSIYYYLDSGFCRNDNKIQIKSRPDGRLFYTTLDARLRGHDNKLRPSREYEPPCRRDHADNRAWRDARHPCG